MRKIAHWTESYSLAESVDILRDLALSHALEGGETGQVIARFIRAGDIKGLCEFELDVARDGWDPVELYNCRQAVAFFSKMEPLDIGYDKEFEAMWKFSEAELACTETNELFRLWTRGDFQFLPRVEAWLFRAQQKIAQVLGPVPSWEALGYRFGKGATTLTKKRMASLREKFRVGVSCSEELAGAAQAVLAELPKLCEAWADVYVADCRVVASDPPLPSGEVGAELEFYASVPVHVMDGQLGFVPKNAKTYRSVVTEPVLNGLAQLAIGDHMAQRLRRVGQDIRDQTRNQILARMGSLTGALATLDLSSASDTISKELVFHLLPLEWASLLARARTGHVRYPNGYRKTLEKFSSMGNGYTFPLETLIFWGLVSAVCEGSSGEVSIYGDDIICPATCAQDVETLLRVCGFTVNEKKSYAKGSFRESCGCDWYSGIDVRPYFQKGYVSNRTLFTLHNYYVRRGDLGRADSVRSLIHPDVAIFGPDGYGDGHLVGPFEALAKPSHRSWGYAGYTFSTFTIKGKKDIRPVLPGDFVLPSYSVYRRSPERLFTVPSLKPYLQAVGETTTSVAKLAGMARFSRMFHRGHGRLEEVLAIPGHRLPDGSHVKSTTFPTLDDEESELEYKRVSIYTLRRQD